MPGVKVPEPEGVAPGCKDDKGGVADKRLGFSFPGVTGMGRMGWGFNPMALPDEGVPTNSPMLEFREESRLSPGLQNSPGVAGAMMPTPDDEDP